MGDPGGLGASTRVLSRGAWDSHRGDVKTGAEGRDQCFEDEGRGQKQMLERQKDGFYAEASRREHPSSLAR